MQSLFKDNVVLQKNQIESLRLQIKFGKTGILYYSHLFTVPGSSVNHSVVPV